MQLSLARASSSNYNSYAKVDDNFPN